MRGSKFRWMAFSATMVLLVVAGCSASGGTGFRDLMEDGQTGGRTINGERLPEGWPVDVPLPDDFSLEPRMYEPTGDMTEVRLYGTTQMGTQELLELYETAMSEWRVTEPSDFFEHGGASFSISFALGDRTLRVGVNDIGGPSEVYLTHTGSP